MGSLVLFFGAFCSGQLPLTPSGIILIPACLRSSMHRIIRLVSFGEGIGTGWPAMLGLDPREWAR